MDTQLPETIRCEVVYGLPDRQLLLSLLVESGTTAIGAVQRSGIIDEFPDCDFTDMQLGIFSNPISHDYVLKLGDRVEIYRPLIADPKEVRRELAAAGKTMGSREP